MNSFENFQQSPIDNKEENVNQFEALVSNNDLHILDVFSEKEQIEIKRKQRILASLAFFIGKDFQIPVELNEAGKGWHWDFKNNIIRIDPKDLLEKDMDYLRFVISHEGGHKRISRTGFIPHEEWQQPGFAFMMNAIEDPRDNNFVAENYPRFREQMSHAYGQDFDLEHKVKDKAEKKLGYQPKHIQAGLEYIKQWFKWQNNEEMRVDKNLPEDVQQVVGKTLASAEDSWSRYPSKQEADDSLQGEENIIAYAKLSYEINRDEVWPEFQKLVAKDMEDQQMQEFMKDIQTGQGEQDQNSEMPQDWKDKLTEEEQKKLEEQIEKAIEEAKKQQEEMENKGKQDGQEGEGKSSGKSENGDGSEPGGKQNGDKSDNESSGEQGMPINLDSLSEELKKKIKDYIDSLPDDKKKELKEKAKESINSFDKEINEEIAGKLNEDSSGDANDGDGNEPADGADSKSIEENDKDRAKVDKSIKDYMDKVETVLNQDFNAYEQSRIDTISIINKLEDDLRDIFVKRQNRKLQSGYKSGSKIDITKRIQEKAKDVSVMESKAWQKRAKPSAKDYSISILVDLSGSMRGNKIKETFKAIVVLTEVLNRLSINVEILGFNDRLYEYQQFKQRISKDTRSKMGSMMEEISDFGVGDSEKAQYNDDGWALAQASKRLSRQKTKEKFLIVLSDGLPEESNAHGGSDYELSSIIDDVIKNTDQKLIGLGIGEGTGHVDKYYPNSIANVSAQDMSIQLSKLIKRVVMNYNTFK